MEFLQKTNEMLDKYLPNSFGGGRHRLFAVYLCSIAAALSKHKPLQISNVLDHIWTVTLVL